MNSDNNFPKEDSIEIITIYRSLYILKKKFEKYKNEINKLYTKYFIKDKSNDNNIHFKIIQVSSLKNLLEEICNLSNMTILKTLSSNELFILDLIDQKKQNEKLKESIDGIYNFITDKLKKYNDIFYNKKIKPSLELNIIEENNENLTNYFSMGEYNKKGKLIYDYTQLLELNKKNSSFKFKEISLEEEFKLNEKKNNILYIETLPIIIADFIQENFKYNIINTDIEDDDLNNEVKNLFDGKILKKVENENKEMKKEINNPNISNEMKLKNLYNQELAVENNIKLYNDILNDKKKTGHDVKYIEDFINKLNKEKIKLNKSIKKEEKKPKNKKIYFLSSNNLNNNNNSKNNNVNDNNNFNKNNFKTVSFNTSNLDIYNIKKNNFLLNFENENNINSLKEIFDFYANQHNPMASSPTFDEIAFRKINLDLAEFSKFCVEFEIPISKSKIVELFKKNTTNRKDMSFIEFKNSLEKISEAMNNNRKENLIKKIKIYNELLNKMKNNNESIKEFKRKSIFNHFNDLNNPNKNNIRNSHRLNTQKASVIYDNKKKLYEKELKENEEELMKLNNLNYKEMFDEFINFIGLNNPKIYRKKMKGFIIPFHDMTERVLQFNIGGYNIKEKNILRDEVIEKMTNDLKKYNNNSLIHNNKYHEYYLKKLKNEKEKENLKNFLYEKKMKEFLERKKKGIQIFKEEEKLKKEMLNKKKILTKEEMLLKKELEEKEKKLEKERKKKEEEEKIKNEEEMKKNIFSYDKIEKCGIDDINLNDLDKQIFLDDDSENSDEEFLKNFDNKIEKKLKDSNIENEDNNINNINIESNFNFDTNINNNYNKDINNNNNNNNNNEAVNENILITQQKNKNYLTIDNIISKDKKYSLKNLSINFLYNNKNNILNDNNINDNNDNNNNFNINDYTNNTNKKNHSTFSTRIKRNSRNNRYLSNFNTEFEEDYNNNINYNLKSQTDKIRKTKTLIKTGENIIKNNKRQNSAYNGQNFDNKYNNIQITIDEINKEKNEIKNRHLLYEGKVKKNQENIYKNLLSDSARLIKKLQMNRNLNSHNNNYDN